MVIGLTGTNGAGKTVAGGYLKSRGFRFHSLSDEIRTELESRNQPGSRENLIEMGKPPTSRIRAGRARGTGQGQVGAGSKTM